jgi:hypothetical protein
MLQNNLQNTSIFYIEITAVAVAQSIANKTKQKRTKQNKTKQNKTKQQATTT